MVDLARLVEDLVHAATTEADPRALRPVVETTLDAFEDAPKDARDAAVRTIGKAVRRADGRGEQVLSLALGALVEGGASPELAWPAIVKDLTALLTGATAFASAVVRHAKDEHVETALSASGAEVAKKKPREAASWKAVPARCLAAVACLTRSKKLRTRARKDEALISSAWALSDVVSEVGDLLQVLRILDGDRILVLAPAVGRGWLVAIDGISSNAELYLLLADALLGDPKKGRLPGKRPDPRAILALRDGTQQKRALSVTLPFHLVAWTAVESDGSLPPPTPDAADHWIWMEGVPADIPTLDGARIVLLQDSPFSRPIPVERAFEALRPELEVAEELSPADVTRMMIKLATAATKTRPPLKTRTTRKPSSEKKKKASAKK